ncbi:hypothetical protein Cgig2_008993 [Carnegiea gigantea]|uniref:CHCH domain-containing protein n=1 Tax=Carnegiea gigantea TaxID=171969 RepID=A0A9Q1K702_9CARY|nr:hypothetical protein Cgig2_008993 [Carnegiea gigantea]
MASRAESPPYPSAARISDSPCYPQYTASLKCLEQYNSDKSKCQEHFDVYKECKKKEFNGGEVLLRKKEGVTTFIFLRSSAAGILPPQTSSTSTRARACQSGYAANNIKLQAAVVAVVSCPAKYMFLQLSTINFSVSIFAGAAKDYFLDNVRVHYAQHLDASS